MKFLFALALLVTGSVFAAEIKVFEEEASFHYPEIDTSWTVNKKTGQAAISIKLYNNNGPQQGNRQAEYYTQKVEGLYFDKDTSKIMFEHEGQLFECASVVKKWYGNRYYDKDCKIDERRVVRRVHNGWFNAKRAYHQVFIITK